MKSSRLVVIAIVLSLLGMPAFAERRTQGQAPAEGIRDDGEFAPDQGPGGPPSEERREEIRKKMEAIRIWRLTEELNLDADTSGRLSALLSSLDQKRRETWREKRDTIRTMRQHLNSQKPDEAKIKQLLEKLENNHQAMQELKNTELKSLKDILTIEQQARFMIFQNEFQREMRAMIGNARAGDGRRRDRIDPGQGESGQDQRPRTRGQGRP